jgi:hypothetical protein
MRGDRGAAVWPARLRWRFRGALLWPLFAILTVADAVLVVLLPVSGRHTGFVPALLLAMFLNLLAVAGLGRLGALWLRRRRPELPRLVAEDRAGTTLLCVVSAALVILGVLHAPARHAADRAVRIERDAVRAFVLAHGPPAYRSHLEQMDTEQEADSYFRSCVPGDRRAVAAELCLLVDTSADPPDVRVDTDRTPNRHS